MMLSKISQTVVLAAMWGIGFAAPAAAEWPAKTVTILVHSEAGSSTDIMARALAQGLESVTGGNFVVSARGREAMPALLNAEADGHTFATQTRSFLPELMQAHSPFAPEDFQWVANLVGESFTYGVREDDPIESFEDLVERSRANPHAITMSTFATGSMHQLSALILNEAAGIEVNIVPYNSGSDLVIAMLGGNIDVAATNPSRLIQQVEAGEARALVVTSPERHPGLPGTPTAVELGYDVLQAHWRGLIAKAGTPEDVLSEIDAALAAAIETEAFANYIATEGLEMTYMGPEEVSAYVEEEMETIAPRLEAMGML